MKKKKLFTALACALCVTVGSLTPVFADSTRVVTLGADLSDAQMQTMLNYFNVDTSEVQIIYVTNSDEYELLGSAFSAAEIGTQTLSCAYVKPTTSGGIKVRTANLNYVNGNMIASALSTAGVKNCEVIAACPIEVSGTGALTGVIKAYEQASSTTLSESKKQLAVDEVVVTGDLRDEVGTTSATLIVNEAKTQVIQNNYTTVEEITNVVNNVVNSNNITIGVDISQEQIQELIDLLLQLSEEDYNYDDVKDTLENVEENVTGESSDDAEEGAADTDSADTEDTAADTDSADSDDESILDDVNTDALSGAVIESSTEDSSLEEETREAAEEADAAADSSLDTDETFETYTEESIDGTDTSGEEEGTDDYTEDGNTDGTESPEDGTDSASLDLSLLSEDAQTRFSQLQLFCAGEYGGDTASLQSALNDPEAFASVILDETTAASLTDLVENAYYSILYNGTDTYIPDGTETYLSTELNMMQDELLAIFGLDETGTADENLSSVTLEDRQTLYNETMSFFESLYGETSYEEDTYEEDTYEEEASGEEASDETAYDEGSGYDEESGYYDETTGEWVYD